MKVKLVIQLGGDVRSWGDVAVLLEGAAANLRDRRRRTAEPEHGEDTPLLAPNGGKVGVIEIVTDREA